MPVLKEILVIDAPNPVNKIEMITTKDLCLSNFLIVLEELTPVF